jgi:hypothetical protein
MRSIVRARHASDDGLHVVGRAGGILLLVLFFRVENFSAPFRGSVCTSRARGALPSCLQIGTAADGPLYSDERICDLLLDQLPALVRVDLSDLTPLFARSFNLFLVVLRFSQMPSRGW